VDERLGDIVADERKVKQILLNLLSNAVKFTLDASHKYGPSPGGGMHPATEPARQVQQVRLVKALVGAGQLAPPVAKPTALLSQREVAGEHDPIHAVVPALQQVGIVLGELIRLFHAARIIRDRRVGRWLLAARRAPFSKRSLGKSVDRYGEGNENSVPGCRHGQAALRPTACRRRSSASTTRW
jgi:hypothetical protein